MASKNPMTARAQLQELQAATNIVLMVIPHDVSFRFRVDEKRLPEVACIYDVRPGLTFDEVLKVLNQSILEYEKDNREIAEARIGIVFKNESNTLQEFYFEDWGGGHNVNGRSGEYRISASADLPNQLRALLKHQDVALVKSGNFACPNS